MLEMTQIRAQIGSLTKRNGTHPTPKMTHLRPQDHPFEKALSVSKVDTDVIGIGFDHIEWLDFWLNPRKLRGSDFLMRWSQGAWSEQRLVAAVNNTNAYYAIPYGPSGAAPTGDVRSYELYFERLEAAGLGAIKRPDLLVFPISKKARVEEILNKLGGPSELPFLNEDVAEIKQLLSMATVAVECENSLWRAAKMPDYSTPLRPQKRLGGRLGLKKNAVLPTVIIKDEDRAPLARWQNESGVTIHVWHVFFDKAYGLSFNDAEQFVNDGSTEPTDQVFQAPGGATTKKRIFKHHYHKAYPLGETVTEPALTSKYIEDKNGHILPYVHFEGGALSLAPNVVEILKKVELSK